MPIEGGSYPGAPGYTIDESRCTGCGICVRACPMGAVSMAVPEPARGGDRWNRV